MPLLLLLLDDTCDELAVVEGALLSSPDVEEFDEKVSPSGATPLAVYPEFGAVLSYFRRRMTWPPFDVVVVLLPLNDEDKDESDASRLS